MSLSTNTATAIQQIFIGLLGRPAKQGGLTYWTGEVDANNGFGLTELLSNIVNSQPEYINAVAGLSRAQVVTLHFNYLFNRNPSFDSEGHNYWVDGPGAAIPADQLVLALIEGASAQDMLVLDNKVTVGNYITQNGAALTNDQARAILATVDTTLASIEDAKDAVDLALNPYELSVADVSVVEGDAGTKLMTFTLNLDKVAATDVVIDYQTAAGTATAGDDYQNAAGTVTIAAGTMTASVSVTVNGDTAFEADETLQVNFTSIQIANAVSATGTIVNDDPIPQTFDVTVSNPSVVEGDAGSKQMNFTITLDEPANQTYVLDYATVAGTATAGADFTATNGQVTFVAGQTTAQVTVDILGDTVYEGNESLSLSISGSAVASVTGGTGTIVENDPIPQTFVVTIADAQTVEGDAGTKVLNFTVLLSDTPNQSYTFDYSTAAGSATAGSDYVGQSGQVTFVAGQTSAQISIVINGDTAYENDETFTLTVDGDAALIPATATGTIVNDDSNIINFTPANPEQLVGTELDDLFVGTDSTAQSGDTVDGDDGDDTVKITNQTSNSFTSLALTDVENVIVTNGALGTGNFAFTFTGPDSVTIASENSIGAVNLIDIQDVNNTMLEITDTTADHFIEYDSNAYLPGNGIDSVDLTLRELRGADDESEFTSADIIFYDIIESFGPSAVDVLNIHSLENTAGQITIADTNYIDTLLVGPNLTTITVDGQGGNDADLMIEDMVNEGAFTNNLTTFDASGLQADVDVDLRAQSLLTVRGGQSNYGVGFSHLMGDRIDVIALNQAINNTNIMTYGGHDDINIEANGDVDLDSGIDNDTVTITGDGSHDIFLQSGNDVLVINGNVVDHVSGINSTNVTDIDAGTGNDSVLVNGNGDLSVLLDTGNDTLTVNGASGNHYVNGSDGNDSVTLNVTSGSHTVYTGAVNAGVADNDTVTINFTDGYQTIITGNQSTTPFDNDVVTINGGVLGNYHYVQTGAANDWLLVTGFGSNSNYTQVNMGSGNDTVEFWQNHRLDVDLGSGDDLIILDAADISVADRVDGEGLNDFGGADSNTVDKDTVRIENESNDYLFGLVTESETLQFQDIEVYDLRDSNITLSLTDTMISTADNNDLTVSTRFATGIQTVDMTPITTPLFDFTLDGGVNRDVLIANDATINSFSTLHFDINGVQDDGLWWVEDDGLPGGDVSNHSDDTLVVVDGATIRHEDTENIVGLDRIHLTSENNSGQIWQIDVNAHFINQATDNDDGTGVESNEDLVITVDPTVPAGSELHITLDPDLINAHADLVIKRTANVTVYINGVVVTEPEMDGTVIAGSSFNGGNGVIVQTLQQYTANGDNLGTAANDLVIATQLDHVQSGDNLEVTGSDTVQFNFAVNNPGASLTDVLENTGVTDVGGNGTLAVVFNTVNNVAFTDQTIFGAWGAPEVISFTTGAGNDLINGARAVTWNMGAGNDTVNMFDAIGTSSITVNGGSGSDVVNGTNDEDVIIAHDVELINAGSGNDSVTIAQSAAEVAAGTDITVNGGAGTDTLTINGQISITTVYANSVEVINDSNNANNIIASNGGGTVNATLNNGDDTISVTAATVTVNGGNGNDSVYVDAANSTVNGGNNDDVITVVNASGTAIVNGNADNDTINVTAQNSTVDGGTGNDSITVFANDFNFAQVNTSVDGGDGNDTINVTSLDSALNINGGNGNDLINVTFATDSLFTDTAIINGGTGNDTINVIEGGDGNSDGTTVTGGAGNDEINLTGNFASGGLDVVVFGNIAYNALQVQTTNTQGVDAITGFNFEAGGAGAEDVLDFSAFLPGDLSTTDYNGGFAGLATDQAVEYGDWTGGVNAVDMDQFGGIGADAQVAVIAADSNFVLDGTHINSTGGAGIEIDDNGRAVVIIGKDTGGFVGGYDTFDVYFVQDIDSDAGQVWAVDLVATITSATEIGTLTSIEAPNTFTW